MLYRNGTKTGSRLPTIQALPGALAQASSRELYPQWLVSFLAPNALSNNKINEGVACRFSDAILSIRFDRPKHEKTRCGEGERPTLLPFALCPRDLTTNFLPRG